MTASEKLTVTVSKVSLPIRLTILGGVTSGVTVNVTSALFVVAPASKFEPVAVRLGIPFERDSESARDAAKAYQRRIQDSESDR